MPPPSRRALQLQAGAKSRSSQSRRSVNQTNFLAELHTRTDEQAALEDQANEEFHEEMQRQAQERDLKVSALAEQQRRQKLLQLSGDVNHLEDIDDEFVTQRRSRRGSRASVGEDEMGDDSEEYFNLSQDSMQY